MQRIFVNPAIKKALCREAKGDRSWLSKVRPFYGHDYHFHIRITCPEGDKQCKPQPAPSESEGCAPTDFAFLVQAVGAAPRRRRKSRRSRMRV